MVRSDDHPSAESGITMSDVKRALGHH
jgi:hypothetical protein